MSNMYRVMAFFTCAFAVMALAGGLLPMAFIFFANTVLFVAVSFLNLSERMYIYIFGAYLTLFFVLFTYWSAFMMDTASSTQ
ncbi:hypothetical protein JOD43_001715 [Pullulanibacillus pueri]|uniref:DUF2626 domain-containing protein n=1 Tax=Pullulanibacillus pueri TaxID=1437324 RepID=A0A8J3ELK1_9BACL|nr:DUF2626 family protein [Pullulanibacillus pueri]MBM7681548.1 hypothetical protein [Pullulanibacillus pueri]GGH79718.1 hypothetical protein GCM10007096_15060 [Pullulanibacillus pueri]